MSHLSFDLADGVATLVLNNPPQNRLGLEVIADLGAALDTIETEEVRAVLLRADGDNFSYGGDIEPWLEWTAAERRFHFSDFMRTFNRFEQLPMPTITAVQGLCYGGGLELAVRSDVVFASENARFGHPEQSIAIVTLLGGIYRVAERAGRARAMEWALTSEQVPAATMERFGVVNRVVPNAELLETARALAEHVAKGPTKAHAAHKALLRVWESGGTAAADDVMFDIALPLWSTEDTQMAIPTAVEALRAGAPRPAMAFQGR